MYSLPYSLVYNLSSGFSEHIGTIVIPQCDSARTGALKRKYPTASMSHTTLLILRILLLMEGSQRCPHETFDIVDHRGP